MIEHKMEVHGLGMDHTTKTTPSNASFSYPSPSCPNFPEFVYTIGCFDMLHPGHVKLFQRMRKFGRRLVIGVHDDASILQLKSRVPIDSTATRAANVAKYADQVFIVAGTNPSEFIEKVVLENIAAVGGSHNHSAVYIRGDDMPHFPGRQTVERYMPVLLLPYTQGVSSTYLRQQLLATPEGAKILKVREEEMKSSPISVW
eukprot:Opistho-1_new@16466